MRGCRVLAALAVSLALAAPLRAQTPPGEAAFAAQDFVRAAPLLREEAATGSAQAMLHLGTMADLGLGRARDPATAFRWYLGAAVAGNLDAQFNVGVMLDAGAGRPANAGAAAVWYARAAAQGHARAQYNLGLLYAAGDGVPRNPSQARLWLTRAARTLPAATARAALLPNAAPQGVAPDQPPSSATALLTGPKTAQHALLSWSAPPGASRARFLVEIARRPTAARPRSRPLVRIETRASALAVPVGDTRDLVWRITRFSPDSAILATRWQALGAADEAMLPITQPLGQVTLRHAAHDLAAMRHAAELSEALAAAGLWVTVSPMSGNAPGETRVRYGTAADAGLAQQIAASLPVLAPGDVRRADSGTRPLAPGEITVDLVGGPR